MKKQELVDALNTTKDPNRLEVWLKLPTGAIETIINTSHITEKGLYYLNAYDDDMRLKANPEVRMTGFRLTRVDDGLTFGQALECVKRGAGMRLPHWAPDVVIRAQYPDESSKMTAPYLYVESRFGRVPWKETMIELFAENWEVVIG